MQVGTTKDQGLYNKPSAAVHPGALAAGTLPQYNTTEACMGKLGSHWTDFHESLHLSIFFSKICRDNSSFIRI